MASELSTLDREGLVPDRIGQGSPHRALTPLHFWVVSA